ncbi:MAG: hypothetical protein M1370_12020 [Bacteroidetes bacterium]|nr:hypothetical protein [Bacteroidota bacterium]MCL5025473.1 hypothetical protein [Chloroflexota bacterium]
MKRLIWSTLVIALVLGLSLAPAAADDQGSAPSNAIDLAGTMSGTLGPGAFTWYRFYTPGDSIPKGVTMNYTPATTVNSPLIGFTVGLFRNGPLGVEFVEVGRATSLNGTINGDRAIKYWRSHNTTEHTYFLRVMNGSWDRVDYAIAYTGSAYPPPHLAISSDEKQPSYGEWPAPDAKPSPEATGGGPNPENAVALKEGRASGVLGPQSRTWLTFGTRGNGRSSTLKLKFNPATETNLDGVMFKVWTYRNTPSGQVLAEVGWGTRGDNPSDAKSWRGGSDTQRAHFIEVINYSLETVNWEIALDEFYAYWK